MFMIGGFIVGLVVGIVGTYYLIHRANPAVAQAATNAVVASAETELSTVATEAKTAVETEAAKV